MSLADEVRKLAELRDSGTLTKEEFERAKARLFDTAQASSGGAGASGSASSASSASASSGPFAAASGAQAGPGAQAPAPVLRRARRDCWLGGVCGGLGYYTGIESWVWRVLFTAAVLFAGFGFLPYLILWIFVPRDENI